MWFVTVANVVDAIKNGGAVLLVEILHVASDYFQRIVGEKHGTIRSAKTDNGTREQNALPPERALIREARPPKIL